eukprot:8902136-Pyramimonas_sp.AAC.1
MAKRQPKCAVFPSSLLTTPLCSRTPLSPQVPTGLSLPHSALSTRRASGLTAAPDFATERATTASAEWREE